jgi:hypothetical protein
MYTFFDSSFPCLCKCIQWGSPGTDMKLDYWETKVRAVHCKWRLTVCLYLVLICEMSISIIYVTASCPGDISKCHLNLHAKLPIWRKKNYIYSYTHTHTHMYTASVGPMSTSIRDTFCYQMRTKLTYITLLKYSYELTNISKNDISHIGARVSYYQGNTIALITLICLNIL